MIRTAEIHARVSWPIVLEHLGIAAAFLRNRHGPCPACGGKDRYRFDNKHGRGTFYCNQCGPGDGFALLQRVFGWTFAEARKHVMEAAGIGELAAPTRAFHRTAASASPIARPTSRVRAIVRSSCAVADCPDAIAYLKSRGLWPLPEGCRLRAHAALDYWDEDHLVGRFPGLVAEVRDIHGDLVTVQITYLHQGRKLTHHAPRKTLSPLTGRDGCAVRLLPLTGPTLGIGEGLESCLAAALLHRMPVWSATSTTLLAKFDPPSEVTHVRVYADNDEAGMNAAHHLAERLQERGMHVQLLPPPTPAKDWADMLTTRKQPNG